MRSCHEAPGRSRPIRVMRWQTMTECLCVLCSHILDARMEAEGLLFPSTADGTCGRRHDARHRAEWPCGGTGGIQDGHSARLRHTATQGVGRLPHPPRDSHGHPHHGATTTASLLTERQVAPCCYRLTAITAHSVIPMHLLSRFAPGALRRTIEFVFSCMAHLQLDFNIWCKSS